MASASPGGPAAGDGAAARPVALAQRVVTELRPRSVPLCWAGRHLARLGAPGVRREDPDDFLDGWLV